ncbi:peptide-methionine (S)-S-oxide reductase MsrA [Myroides odoratimimus]|uniref:Peptide methionine sulfoxide reductase MsrA n=1 Tax=Myroides odoratimimus CIP 101113 TaxID=883154 RepID=A0AAV3F2P0_9FLAO|nr:MULTISPECIES: peptide-methionine (S)-S-oxide reductase MsrA [Myroides]AJA70248.1 methionine-S-sulfoxide reductase [Myroides sp. A21]EHO11398.1 peptide-methionine (S)-S-oxide reductase [Myroides odoratimimus CIP 101113]EKB06430.1 peptide-methionine (S)-S-oxide reductase [Myroides odoratimimus CCUG 3837]MEC4054182.1 peptide-methionine (S)-S-oxide reductase MsrA [Myroides odoratimimus]QBK77510.1 peptide-methionine (S)-S-oxide reductase [Myroides odoratimimus]
MENNKLETAIFGAGCFWCIEAIYKSLKGVEEVLPGYIGGKKENPTYEEVCTGETGHAEVVKLVYNPAAINYNELLEVFFTSHNPTTLNRQGEDVGTQYRSEIFYTTEAQKAAAKEYLDILSSEKVYDDPIVTKISEATKFYVAEDYHKNYFEKSGDKNPYCQLVVKPKLDKFKAKYNTKLK